MKVIGKALICMNDYGSEHMIPAEDCYKTEAEARFPLKEGEA
jgi:hypothetical protein